MKQTDNNLTVTHNSLPTIAIAMGDPAGIGPEVILKSLQAPEVYDACKPVVIGDARVLTHSPGFDSNRMKIQRVSDVEQATPTPSVLSVLDLKNVPPTVTLGNASAEGGRAMLEYLRKSVELALAGRVAGIAFAPLNKQAMMLGGLKHPDEYGYISELAGAKEECAVIVMGSNFAMTSVTLHVPIQRIASLITKDRVLQSIRYAHLSARAAGKAAPRIAVAALNPHAGEHGLIGTEEETAIRPAIQAAAAEDMDVAGPFPPDTLFTTVRENPFDVYVTMYHDQGRIPLKLLEFGRAVTVGEGLPFLVCTPSHGTAYDIAGKGLARHENMLDAILFVARRSGGPQHNR